MESLPRRRFDRSPPLPTLSACGEGPTCTLGSGPAGVRVIYSDSMARRSFDRKPPLPALSVG